MNILFSGTGFNTVKSSSQGSQNAPLTPALYTSTSVDKLTLRFGKDALTHALQKAAGRGCTESAWNTDTYCVQAEQSSGGYFRNKNGQVTLSASGRSAYRRKFGKSP